MNPITENRFSRTEVPARRTTAIARYAWKQRRGHLLTIGLTSAVIFFSAVGLEVWRGTFMQRFFTWEFWEPTLQFSILAVACLVWWGEVAQDWANSLPRRLTVWFLYPRQTSDTVSGPAQASVPARAFGQVALLCEEAYLAGEGDIRTWGQSIGMQMAKGLLAFEPNIVQTPPRRVWREEDGPFLHYHVLFRLSELPREKGQPPGDQFIARQLLRWERGQPQPLWESGAWVIETSDGWALMRTCSALASVGDQ